LAKNQNGWIKSDNKMGGLVSSVLSWFSGKPDVRILILGLDAAGKTTILFRLSLSQYVQHVVPTVAFNLEKVEVGNLKLQIWDLGGQHQLRPFWRLYYKESHGVVYVIDSTDRQRIDLCKTELFALLQEEELKGVPLVILANKQDLAEAMSVEELTNKLELASIKERAWNIYPTSAVNGNGIKEGFTWLSENVESKMK